MMKRIILLILLCTTLISLSQIRQRFSPAIFRVEHIEQTIVFKQTDSTQTVVPCQSVASIVANANPSKIVSLWVVRQDESEKILQFDYSVCGFSSKQDAVDSLTSWSNCSGSSGGGSQSALNDSIATLRSIRKVDSIYKKATNRDLTYFKVNGIEYSVKDSVGSGGGGTTTYAGQGLFLRNDSLLITGRLTEPMSILSVGSPVNNPIGGVATVWSDIPTRPTITNACYSDDFSHTTGTEVINFSTINTQIVQTGIFDQNSSLDLDDTKLFFVNDNGIKSTYLIGLPTNDTADQVVLRDMATNELYVSDAGQFVELHATTMVNNAITQLRSDIADTATGLQTRIDTKTNKLITTNRQTASYSLVLSDADKLVEMNVGSANDLTVPLNSSIAFPVGTQILISQYGAGQTTIVPTGGVTVRSASGKLKLTGQYSGASLVKIGTNEWYLFGDLTN